MSINASEFNASYSSVEINYSATYKNQSVSAEVSATKTEVSASATSNASSTTANEGVIYESSNIKNMSESDRASLVKKLKADAESRVAQLRSLVEKMFLQQGQKVTDCDNMWKFLASGNFTVDRETAEAAQEAISEDGYWGVEQTSQRIFDMAVALSGGDSEKMDDMLKAFKKGFNQATETWGKELPDISQKTYGAVLEKFEAYKNENSAEVQEAQEAAATEA